jgi:hypothetical protein
MYLYSRSLSLSFLATLLLCTYSGTMYPLFSYFGKARDLFASRMSEATDEEIAFLEAQNDTMAQIEAMRLRTTWADFMQPLVAMHVEDALSTCVYTPLNYIGAKTGFNTMYNWFAKKITYKQVMSSLARGILVGAVIFSVNEVAKKKLHPDWVKKNYYARTVAKKICSRVAVAVGMGLLGACAIE